MIADEASASPASNSTELGRFLARVNRIAIPWGIPPGFVPFGRRGRALDRDRFFEGAAETAIERLGDLSNTFFINYTGHQASVGAALAAKGVTVYWALDVNERIANAMQDRQTVLVGRDRERKTPKRSPSAVALMLEPNHPTDLFAPPSSEIRLRELPTLALLRGSSAQRVIVFNEDTAGDDVSVDRMKIGLGDDAFHRYLQTLSYHGIDVRVVGLNPP
jgi:hypothetical protein